ncbi:MAG: hypothetical protein ACRBF0_21385 [Calditrichia bacterium]
MNKNPKTDKELPVDDNLDIALNKSLGHGIDLFMKWLDGYGYAGYDLYDLWATRYGKWAKGLYHEKKYLGTPFVVPVFFADYVWPQLRKYVAKKKRYATADAHYAFAFLTKYRMTGEKIWLEKVVELAEAMESYVIEGYSGPCWGYPFDWQTNRGLWPEGTPFITTTPYVYKVFAELADITSDVKYADMCRGIANFALKDLNKRTLPNGTVSTSYSPIDSTTVVNANAYRATILADAGTRFSDQKLLEEARKNCRFILAAQREDGAWLYDVTNPHDEFIDNFHTCIVLKNLIYTNSYLNLPEINKAVIRGYDFYLQNLMNKELRPKPFYHVNRMQLVKQEMYDYAEGINLGILLADRHPEALKTAKRLGKWLLEDYQTPEGYFVTRELLFGIKMRFPTPRWTQSQLFASLCLLQSCVLKKSKTIKLNIAHTS